MMLIPLRVGPAVLKRRSGGTSLPQVAIDFCCGTIWVHRVCIVPLRFSHPSDERHRRYFSCEGILTQEEQSTKKPPDIISLSKEISITLTQLHATMKTLHKSLVVNKQAHRSCRFMGSQAGSKKYTSPAAGVCSKSCANPKSAFGVGQTVVEKPRKCGRPSYLQLGK